MFAYACLEFWLKFFEEKDKGRKVENIGGNFLKMVVDLILGFW